KRYGETNPPLTGTLVGLQNGDQISVAFTTLATNRSPVGAYAISPVLNDPDAKLGNYTVVTNLGTLVITQALLQVSAQGVDKVYDGTTVATVVLQDNRLAGDSLTVAYSAAAFADPSSGTNKTVTVSGITVTGADASNYTFNTIASTRATITAAVPPPNLTIQDLGNGSFRIQFSGLPGYRYRIEYCQNVDTPVWQPLGSATADDSGWFSYLDTPPSDSPQRFYRSAFP
ncbi:MAG TPA: YDG domain-containing protein, partial [Bacillota bacterium]|nr:YDG domain-containing protein [Bacillota bacterium]